MFRALRVRNYRLFASGQIITNVGIWMQRVAQDWLVLELTNSGTALGIVTALQFGPMAIFGLWGGMLADRYDKRKLLIAARAFMGLQALALGLLILTGLVAVWQVYVLAALLGLGAAIETPARQSFVVEMVGPKDLPNALGLNAAMFNSARIVGPAVAGVGINLVGTGWVFIATAASSISVIVGLIRIRVADLQPMERAVRASGQLRAGLAYVRERVDLVVPLLMVFVIGTFGMNFQLTLPLMVREVFHRGAGSYGALSTCLAVGSLVGALLATLRSRRPRLRFLLLAAFAFGTMATVTGLMPSYLSLAIILPLTGTAALTFMTACNTTVQMGIEAQMRGRVMALYLLCFFAGTPVGAPLIGWLAQHYGPRASIVVGGLVCAAAAVVVALVLARRTGVGVGELAARLRHPARQPEPAVAQIKESGRAA
jgi:MFS family permease